jgi:7-cyano-7-deazaguanine synthase
MSTRAVVLLSGGLDSVTVLALARDANRDVHALSFLYGQRHAVELQCARRQATKMGVRAHEIVDLQHMGRPATALVAGSVHDVPKHDAGDRAASGGVPITYVPARNTLFLSYALAWAEVLGAGEIWLGVNALDYSGYPDCRPDFLAAFERVANLGTRVGRESTEPAIRIEAPLVDLHKHEIALRGTALGVDYADTVSCYDPVAGADVPLACGRCDSCRLRREGFARAGLVDPTRYATPSS